MTRMLVPTPTRGPAPSHSPPDVRYAPGRELARALGWFGIALGLGELLAPRAMAELTGVRQEGLLQAFGLREIVSGIGILNSSRPTAWMWSRVAGDAMDLAALGSALLERHGNRHGYPLAAAAAVAGITALDLICSMELTTAAALEG